MPNGLGRSLNAKRTHEYDPVTDTFQSFQLEHYPGGASRRVFYHVFLYIVRINYHDSINLEFFLFLTIIYFYLL